MSDEFWTIEDFGFTAVNESELEVAKQASTASSSAKEQEEKRWEAVLAEYESEMSEIKEAKSSFDTTVANAIANHEHRK